MMKESHNISIDLELIRQAINKRWQYNNPYFILLKRNMGSSQPKTEKKTLEEEKYFIYKEMVKKTAVANPETHYKFLERIGEGSYAEVYKVQSLSTGQIRVIKKVQRNSSPTLGRHLFNQFDILREMDHPNIVKMFQMFEDENYHYIVTQYLPGKDALDLLVSQKSVSEEMAFHLFYSCLLAVNYLHKNKVMHRDIKLENIIYDEQTMCFKLLDFGSALRFTTFAPQERRSTGTIHYMAPEVFNKYYNCKCDVWSLGVLLYILLSGSAPFMGAHEEIIQKILKQSLKFNKPVWETRSKEVKCLITRMLQKNFQNRPSVAEILKDTWVLNHKSMRILHKSQLESICLCLERLMKFRKIQFSDIQLGILLFMINFIFKVENQIALIRSFICVDQLCDGEIDLSELKQALMDYLRFQCKTADEIANEIVHKIDLNGNKCISFSEFVLGATDLRKVITQQNILQTFRYIDTDNSQKLSMLQLQARLGDHLQANQYERLVGLFDTDNDGQIDLAQFSQMMTELLKQY